MLAQNFSEEVFTTYELWFKTQNLEKGNKHSPHSSWVKPHRNWKWWNDFPDGGIIPEECNENFGMSKHSFCILWGKLRPYIEKQAKWFNKPVFVEKQGASTLSDEGKLR